MFYLHRILFMVYVYTGIVKLQIDFYLAYLYMYLKKVEFKNLNLS
jgi:hypothetical protein